MIAGIIRAPAAYSPWTHFDAARRRSFVVLQRMREEKKITPQQEQAARAEQIRIGPLTVRIERTARLRERIPAAAVPRHLRRRQSARLESPHHASFRKSRTRPRPPCATDFGSLAAKACRRRSSRMDPSTGNLLAMVGGSDFSVDAVQPRRS